MDGVTPPKETYALLSSVVFRAIAKKQERYSVFILSLRN